MSELTVIEAVMATYKVRKALRHDYQMAKRLGIERTALSNYKKGARRLPDRAVAELADGTDLPIDDVIAAVNISLASTSEEDRHFWFERIKTDQLKRLSQQFGVHAVLLAVLATVGMSWTDDSQAAESGQIVSARTSPLGRAGAQTTALPLYIM